MEVAHVTLNKSPLTRLMTDLDLSNSDLEMFSGYLGFKGIDADVFYETYYQLDTEEFDDMIEEYLWN